MSQAARAKQLSLTMTSFEATAWVWPRKRFVDSQPIGGHAAPWLCGQKGWCAGAALPDTCRAPYVWARQTRVPPTRVSHCPNRIVDSELRARLQAVLSDSYQIERELAGGGMSRVFVALERALGRQVVIKVLPSDLAASVSIERFRREIQLAAQLQHPHIVPLLVTGEAAGLPYFTMPFVTGESLRLRLAHGELPVHDAVRILREIASALEFAHSHGVVHRDVKPDNILLSGGSAMVTDFGVAKALSVSTTSEHNASVTSLGVALGTPAYMAPEQAAADTRVDHRADIYGFGCLAYEMLCGSTPFGGRSASGTLAAQVSETPESLERRRPSVPPLLVGLVMRCLEKNPADRPQHASEIVLALDAMSTPSSGTRPATAGASRRTPMVLGIAALLVAGGSAAFVASRSSRSATDAASHSIAVLPFVSADTANEFFADGMTDDLASALGKVEGLRVAARSSAFSFKGRNIDVKEIGQKLNVGSVLEGTVRRAQSHLKVTAELINVSDGLTLWSDRWDRDAKDVFAVQDEISRAIVAALKIRLTGGTAAKLAVHGTKNVEAHDLYLRGRFLTNRFTGADLRNSLDLYQQALAIDPNYAPAYTGIADAYVNLADDWLAPREAYPKAKVAVLRALALDDESAEAHSSLGTIHLWSDWDGVAAQRELRRAVALDSSYARAHFYLGRLHAIRLHYDSAVAELHRAAALDPLAPRIWSVLSSVLNSANRPDEAIGAAKEALKLDPLFAPAHEEMGNALRLKGDLAGAKASFDASSSSGSVWSRGYAAQVAAATGHRDVALAAAAALARDRRISYIPAEVIAGIYAALDDRDRAFQWLDSSLADRSGVLPEAARDHRWDPLRTDPRWASLMARINWK